MRTKYVYHDFQQFYMLKIYLCNKYVLLLISLPKICIICITYILSIITFLLVFISIHPSVKKQILKYIYFPYIIYFIFLVNFTLLFVSITEISFYFLISYKLPIFFELLRM